MGWHAWRRMGWLVLPLVLAAAPARADDCDAPVARWQTREAVRQMAAAQGWQIERLKIDDGCYEIRATDAQGRHFKAKLDPATLKVLKIKPAERRRARSHDHEGAPRPDLAPPPGAASGAAPAPPRDAAPRGRSK